MDCSSILIAGFIMMVVDLCCHFLISDREVKKLKAESARFEREWQSFLKEVNEVVKAKQ